MTEENKDAAPSVEDQEIPTPEPPPSEKAEKAIPAVEKNKSEESEETAEPKAKEQSEGESEEANNEAKPSQPSAKDLLEEEVKDIKIRRAKGSKNVTIGVVHILATFNNTKVTFSDLQGNAVSWSSAGKCNFRGSRKSTAYAAQVVTQDAGRRAMSHGMKEVEVRLKGPGMGRDSAVRSLQSLGFIITSIADVTPVPHNGCRPRKRRRV